MSTLHSLPTFLSRCALVLALAGPLHSSAQIFLFDFGATANMTEHGPAPEDPGNYWNNVNADIGSSATGQLLNLVASDNTPTDIDLFIVSRFNGSNPNGTQLSALFPDEATRDSLFGNTEIFNNLENIFPSFRLSSLDPASTYNFTFYASRTEVSDIRETGYTVQGENSGFAALNAANNVDATASVENIVPDASGAITISLAPTANNNNAFHFTYLGVMKMIAAPPQTPIVFTQEPVNTRVAEFEPVTFTAAVQGSPPYFIQWFSNDFPVPGANQFTYTIPVATLDMNNSHFSVNVSNLAFSATSSNAVLRVVNDTNPPVLVAVSSADGLRIMVEFSELVETTTATFVFNYEVNGGSDISQVELLPDGKTVALSLSTRISGEFVVAVFAVMDLSGNEIVSGSSLTNRVPDFETQSLLFDFGAAGVLRTTEHGPAPDDPTNYWNNVTPDIGQRDDGQLVNLVTSQNLPTSVGLSMIRRFNGFNESGTLAPAPFPTDATRDSLFGNTEPFGGLENIFPSFKLIGLNPGFVYDLTFYASRTGVSDNRETGYTVQGATDGFTTLNAANNVGNTARVTGMAPDAAGEITISLAPTANNNNASHFTYLGVLKVDPTRPGLQFLPSSIADGQIILNWTGNGLLEWAPTPSGPWTAYDPAPATGFSEPIVPDGNRFYRLQAVQ